LPRKIKRRSTGSRKGMGDMLQQLQKAQEEMLKAQEELAAMTVTATSGGGAVTAVVTGERRVQSLTIVPDVVDADDVDMLQDLIIAAINKGMEEVDQNATEQMESFTGGLGIADLL